jgi:hypothetical protein
MPEPGDALDDFGDGFAAIAGDHPDHLCHRGAQRRRTVGHVHDIAPRQAHDAVICAAREQDAALHGLYRIEHA